MVHCCAYTLGYPSPKAAGPPITSLLPEGLLHKRSDAGSAEESPTNVRCKAPHLIKIILEYSPKKKEQTPLKTGVRYNKAISQAVSFPLEVMEVWINRQKVFIS
ncbi:hypothetical protein ZWY2020_051337 [Hordeum vulgare]|nr:hypothetical protein ZWY2020_051337 [Hordeum vulgare]